MSFTSTTSWLFTLKYWSLLVRPPDIALTLSQAMENDVCASIVETNSSHDSVFAFLVVRIALALSFF